MNSYRKLLPGLIGGCISPGIRLWRGEAEAWHGAGAQARPEPSHSTSRVRVDGFR